MLDITLTITLALKGPILTQSSVIGSYGVDNPMARTGEGKYYLPGTLVKGRLRQSWEELYEAAGGAFTPPIDIWLGKQMGSSTNISSSVEPSRGLLRFTDFIHSTGGSNDTLYRIRMDERRGAVDKGAYQVIEAPFAPRERVSFVGNVHYTARDETEANNIRRFVEIGLRWITSLGAERTVGFGQLIDVNVELTSRAVPTVTSHHASGSTFLDFVITPKAPFCIARRQVSPNLFESDSVISGGILKGCLASTWRSLLGLSHAGEVKESMDPARPELCRYFVKLRFTHAFPTLITRPARPVVAPLSLVKDQAGKIYDVALCEGPGLIGNPPFAPSFFMDWKRSGDVQSRFGWKDPERELRVRTAIDRYKRKAKEEQLFAYEMIVPSGSVWCAGVNLSLIPAGEQGAVEAQLHDVLSHGLRGLGKTKVSADVELKPQGSIQPVFGSQAEPRDGYWVLTLQTPALLCDPAQLNESSGHTELHATYAAVWAQLSDNSLGLVRPRFA